MSGLIQTEPATKRASPRRAGEPAQSDTSQWYSVRVPPGSVSDVSTVNRDCRARSQFSRLGLVRFSDEEVHSFECQDSGPAGSPGMANDLNRRAPHLAPWFAAVEQLQRLHQAGTYRIMFFMNLAPHECPGADRFFDHGSCADNDAVMRVLGRGTPAVSAWPELLHYRPSQMPGASGHSLGNANLVKAEALFRLSCAIACCRRSCPPPSQQ